MVACNFEVADVVDVSFSCEMFDHDGNFIDHVDSGRPHAQVCPRPLTRLFLTCFVGVRGLHHTGRLEPEDGRRSPCTICGSRCILSRNALRQVHFGKVSEETSAFVFTLNAFGKNFSQLNSWYAQFAGNGMRHRLVAIAAL